LSEELKVVFSRVSRHLELDFPAELVWNLIGDFNGLPSWHPEVHASELEEEGTVRRLVVSGGEIVRERVEGHDSVAREYEYSLLESDLPVRDYRARLRVRETGETRCRVEWASRFSPHGVSEEEAIQIIGGIYQAGFKNLIEILPKNSER